MHYLIDGYNLLHHVGRLTGRRPANLEAARLDLLRRLHERFAKEAVKVTVVFDAQGAPRRVKEQQEYLGIEVRYTRNEEADDLIEEILRGETAPVRLTLVSNDRRLKEAARRKGCPVIECVAFWESLDDRPREHPPPASEPERPSPSREEVDAWVQEFGDLEKDPRYRDLFGPEEFGDPPTE